VSESAVTPWWEGLTEKQRRFCEAFAENGGNAFAAARAAGYRKPKQQGSENLEKPGIRAAIDAMRKEQTTKSIATREERQSFWTAMMRGEEPGEPKDRLKASELLGKSQADFIDRKEITGANGGPVAVVIRFVKSDK